MNSAPFYKKLSLELGGKNPVLIFDDCNLEVCVATTIRSSFLNQGEICLCGSRIYVQEGIYDRFMAMFLSKVKEMKVGDPKAPDTNCGALVSFDHMQKVKSYIQKATDEGGKIEAGGLEPFTDLPPRVANGFFVRPTVITGLPQSSCVVKEEIFGPIPHVVRFKSQNLDKVIDEINGTGYGLTLGVHSRIDETIERVRKRAHVGNLYVNRSMIGAVVGVQPFGGEGFSGTGPKAGGPHYLSRFTVERTFTYNTTAAGGNASLLADME